MPIYDTRRVVQKMLILFLLEVVVIPGSII